MVNRKHGATLADTDRDVKVCFPLPGTNDCTASMILMASNHPKIVEAKV